MSHPLTRVPFLGQFVDERFLEHRRKASSVAGIITAVLALVVFEYRLLRYGVFDWELAAVALVFVAIKMGLFLWYRFRD
ncbi:hypothetical protein [Terracidiphilus gabretensis]|uniref:hypothetical protein n=1 Tax=Terracidiphilus gabretensis TaxID=1577687 RepID=UPI00071B071F|nr:hypothetical protein [Terracidiphilus gabretensis]